MSSGQRLDAEPIDSITSGFADVTVSATAQPDADADEASTWQGEEECQEIARLEDSQDEKTNLNPTQVQDAVNIASQMIAVSVALITCPIHENCDGACSGPPVVFAPIAIGDFPFKVAGDRPNMYLPPEPEHPVEIPNEALEYSKIDLEPGEIRLIHVHDAVFQSDPIVVDIVTVKFNDPDMPKYAALSYHWGTPVFNHTLICDGKKLQINESLHNCLKRHRQEKPEKPRYLWVDAICINQKDTEELISQILQMRKIYENAEIVFVDFGNASLQFYFAYDLLYRIKIAKSILKNHLRDGAEIRYYISQYGLLPPLDGPEWGIFRQLFASSWLKRTWTVQEVTLAREIRCRYGRFTFDWESLISAFEFQANQPQSLNWSLHISSAAYLGLANFYRIVLIGMDYKLGRLKPLDLLWRTRDCEVSNPRDRVIALLGLFPFKYHNFRPDYTISPELLFHRFAVHVLRSYLGSPEQASILSYAGLHR